MSIDRRKFLQLAGLTVAGFFSGIGKPAQAAAPGIPGVKDMGMLIDVSRCIGCLSCSIACKKANDLPEEYTYALQTTGDAWSTVKFVEKENGARINLKIQCMHCENPGCVFVCPTGAIYKRADGVVVIDQDTCIGCNYCAVGCPFGIPGKSEETGTARKCNFCLPRLLEGKIPACAEACPTEAIIFGRRDELLTKARERVESLKANGNPQANLFGANELGGLKVLYVLPDLPENCGLPAGVRPIQSDNWLKWVAGLVTAGLVVAGPLWRLFRDDGQSVEVDKGVGADG
jgi:formate dehydrogenase iron-sulfur subunit